MVTLFFFAPSSSISCNGSKTFSIPSILCSPKYKRLASSSASCHCSCQRIATLISSFDTSCACGKKSAYYDMAEVRQKQTSDYYQTWSTRTPLCFLTLSTTSWAAALRKLLIDLQATSKGYMRACKKVKPK